MAAASVHEESIGIISGGGSIPGAVADAVTRSGRRPVLFAIKGWAEPALVDRYVHHWVALGQLGRLLRLARAERCSKALFIGTVLRPPLRDLRLDWQTIRWMPRIAGSFRGGDDHLLSGVADLMEQGGLQIIGLDEVAPEVMFPEGVLGRHQPSDRDHTDIQHALRMIAALGSFDVGQAAVVANNHVLAVEAAEGTDNMLKRIADLRRAGRVTAAAGTGVLVKAPKPGQDRRFDLPSIGPSTIAHVTAAGLAGVAVTAGSTIIAEPAKVIAAADAANVFLVGVRENPA